MAEIGKAYVQVIPSAKGIKGNLEQTLAPEATMAGTSAGTRVSQALSSKLKTIGGGMMKAGAIATAVSVPIIAGIKKSLNAYQVQEQAETKLTEIYKTRMGASKKAAQGTMELASALQKEGIIGDEVQLSGAQQLATFAKYPSTVNTILPAMNNLLAQQKGYNATAEDATSIANLMGKAMQGQTGALKRVGISFTDAQAAILKTGTEEEKAAVLAQVVTDNVGNMNKEMAKTPLGKITQMKNAWGDLIEQVGGMFAPILADVANVISSQVLPKIEQVINIMKANPILAKVVLGLAAVLAIGGPVLIILGSLTSAVGSIIGVIGPLVSGGGGFAGLAKIIGAVGAKLGILAGPVGIAVALFAALYASSEKFRNAVNGIGKALLKELVKAFEQLKPSIKTILEALKQLASVVMSAFSQLGDALAPLLKELQPLIVFLAKTILNNFVNSFKMAAAVLKFVMPYIQGFIELAVALVSIVASALTAVIRAFKKLGKNISSVMKSVKKSMNWNTIVKMTQRAWKSIQTHIINPIKNAWSKVTSTVSKIKEKLKFSGLAGTVRGIWNRIKSAITAPIDAAKNKVSSVISTIKGLFPISIGRIFSNLKIPKITVSGGKAPFGIGGKGSLPSFNVTWNAKGAIVDGATLIGAGEKGKEAILPLTPFWKKLDNMKTGNTTNYYIGDVTLNVDDLEDILTLEDFVEVIKRAKAFA